MRRLVPHDFGYFVMDGQTATVVIERFDNSNVLLFAHKSFINTPEQEASCFGYRNQLAGVTA